MRCEHAPRAEVGKVDDFLQNLSVLAICACQEILPKCVEDQFGIAKTPSA